MLTDSAELPHISFVCRHRVESPVIRDRLQTRVFPRQNRSIQRGRISDAIVADWRSESDSVGVVLLSGSTESDVQPAPHMGRIRRRMRGSAGVRRPLIPTGATGLDAVRKPSGSSDVFDVFLAHFLVEDAVEEEDEEALERVERREDVGHDDVFLSHEEQSRDPSESEQNDENGGSFDPRGDSDISTLMLLSLWTLMNAGFVGFRHRRVSDASVFAHLRKS